MAYMPQDKKARIQAELKKVIPATWKWSLAVRHHSTLVLTIASADVDLIAEQARVVKESRDMPDGGSLDVRTPPTVNHYYLERQFDGKLLETFQKIRGAMNLENHDNSDIRSDYFDVGHYISIKIGRWDKPFVVTR